MLILGNFIGLIGNLLCALAPKISALVAGSVLIGLGSSMHQLGWACVGEIVPKKRRPVAMAIFETAISPASFLGSLIGNAISSVHRSASFD